MNLVNPSVETGDGESRRPRHRRRELPRCPVCGLHLPLCQCAIMPRIWLPWRLIVVQHGVELDRPTNTGRVALRMLVNSERVVYGRRGVEPDWSPLEDPRLDYLLLFPRTDADSLCREDLMPRAGRMAALVVVDGTWSQASHMTRRIPPLRQMRCVKLPPGPPGIWHIRKPRCREQLCTLEAVIRAVAIFGAVKAAVDMLRVLKEIHDRMWAMREGRGKRWADIRVGGEGSVHDCS